MSRALYTAVSGLKIHQSKLDVIGNNIANTSTYGFKSSRMTFRDVFYQNLGNGGGSNAANGGLGGQNPYQIGYGAMVSTIDVNQTKTGFASTGYGGDCYLNGDGFFVVGLVDPEATDGMIGEYYLTRLGAFDFDNAGYLVDGNGQLVCGTLGTEGENGQNSLVPIHYIVNEDEQVEGALPLKNISIESDGLIKAMGNDGLTYGFGADGQLVQIGGGDMEDADDIAAAKATCVKVAVANVINPNGLEMVGNSYYTPTSNAGNVEFYQAGTNNMGSIKTGGLEMSGTDISQEFADMIMTQRAFQANARIVSVVDSMLEEVVNLKR